MSVITGKGIYQLKVTLVGTKPPIWRRILVPSNIQLNELHMVLQRAMGWENYHLHQFVAGGITYGIHDDEFGMDMEVEDEKKCKLHEILRSEKKAITYEYDFGDSWVHKVVLEKILPYDKDQQLPRCIAGKRACPPEDCGGVWGYEEMLDLLQHPEDPEYEERMEWLGGEFDPDGFNVAEVNLELIGYFEREHHE